MERVHDGGAAARDAELDKEEPQGAERGGHPHGGERHRLVLVVHEVVGPLQRALLGEPLEGRDGGALGLEGDRREEVVDRRQPAFPTDRVYGPIDYPGLRLITCGGPFDTHDRNYLDNVVVYAVPVAATAAPQPATAPPSRPPVW